MLDVIFFWPKNIGYKKNYIKPVKKETSPKLRKLGINC
jgi:hypothetical protein